MRVIVLSAGQGKRLLPLTADRPKCALPLGDRTALEWQLQAFAEGGAEEVVVVTGFKADIVREIVAGFAALHVRTTHNPFFDKCDNLGTCWIARHEMQAPFAIVNGDTLFEPAVFRRLLDTEASYPIMLVTNTKLAYDEDDMKVVVEGDRLVRVDKRLPLDGVDGESIGMMKFNAEGAALFRAQLDEMMESETTMNRWYLSAIDALAAKGAVGVVNIGNLDWCEIDDADDLAHAAATVPQWWAPVTAARAG